MLTIEQLTHAWLTAKETERLAVETRRNAEDELIKFYNVNVADEGSHTFDMDSYKMRITCKLSRKIDSDKLQEIAAENGILDSLPILFRWKPEIANAAWKASTEQVRHRLSAAITSTPGRPTFTIEKKEQTS